MNPLPVPLPQLDLPHLLALAAALGWASGLRLYGVVFAVGLAGRLGLVALPPGLAALQHGAVLGLAGALLLVEFVADKVPWVDSTWDAVHTFVRIPAGAWLAGAVFSGLGVDADSSSQLSPLLAGLMGGTLAATAHVSKATVRASVNTLPEPFSNLALSLAGDLGVPAMLWLAWSHPVLFGAALVLVVAAMVLATVLLFRFLRAALRHLKNRFAGSPQQA